ncbi:hypothetical protein SEA_MRMIYAGI_42 [Mycobacterium phage MrMiyagi]|uniref:Uncharacterized protein n=1 Tax=Mycobacterium phage MrMiyagi TaxID=2762395 RepID=A0A7G8LPT4_9CAUD|nr:hypothetical protein SEA_MRMIYAGI_42 [Mycobacterium phage MrMiyagi]
MITDAGLIQFRTMLQENGFQTYEFKRGQSRISNNLKFSRVVDGQTCYGTVSLGYFGAYEFSMPIKPSRENGSSMWVDKVDNLLTLENAKKVARPFNSNPLVGSQANYHDQAWHERLYVAS